LPALNRYDNQNSRTLFGNGQAHGDQEWLQARESWRYSACYLDFVNMFQSCCGDTLGIAIQERT